MSDVQMISTSMHPIGSHLPRPSQDSGRDFKALRDSVNAARDFLAKLQTMRAWEAYLHGAGEAQTMNYIIGSLNIDEKGVMTQKEWDELQEVIKNELERVYAFLLNTGVVSALVISIFFEYTVTELEPSNRSINYFGEEGVEVLTFLFSIAMMVDILVSMVLLGTSLRIYHVLNFLVLTPESRLMALTSAPFYSMAVLNMSIIIITSIAIALGAAVSQGPANGVIAIVMGLLYLGWHTYVEDWRNSVLKRNPKDVKAMLARLNERSSNYS